ncbi:MAG: RNA polymerase sigma factor [Myxococcales bacterium]|nr:RNA polymerase sigma factor [Myxococcales bacterium]
MPIVSVAPEGDLDLVARLRRGDRMAISEAYSAHHAPVRAFARRLLGDDAAAEDVVHDTFIALPRTVANFRGASSLRSFVIGVAANRARRHVRTVARRRRAMARLAETTAVRDDHAVGPDHLAQRRRLAERLALALDQLAHDQRVAFVLCEVEQRSAVEVAVILAVPEGTVRSRVFHARRRLRELLAEEAPRG